jgi:hypothetical protein
VKIEIDGREHPAQLRALAQMLMTLAEAEPERIVAPPVVIEPPVVIQQTRTLEDVRALLKEVQDRKIDAKPLLLEYGATKLTEIPKDKYDEIYERGLKL